MHLSLPKQFPLFILASSFCWSLLCLISSLTEGGESGHFFRLTCSVVLWRRNTANIVVYVESTRSVWVTLGLPLLMVCVLSQSTLLRLQVALQGMGPGMRVLSRSKLLRFRFLGTPQRHRLGWTCVLCPYQVRAAQATKCLVNTVSPRWGGGGCILLPPSPIHLVFRVAVNAPLSGVPCVSSGELISGCDPPSRCQPSRIPGSLG